MPVTFDSGTEPGLIRLEGEVDISQADELKQVLLAALREERGVRVAVETAAGMDITAVQLLWAAEREAKASGQLAELVGPVPEALCVTVHEAGFDRFPLAGEPEPSCEVRW